MIIVLRKLRYDLKLVCRTKSESRMKQQCTNSKMKTTTNILITTKQQGKRHFRSQEHSSKRVVLGSSNSKPPTKNAWIRQVQEKPHKTEIGTLLKHSAKKLGWIVYESSPFYVKHRI